MDTQILETPSGPVSMDGYKPENANDVFKKLDATPPEGVHEAKPPAQSTETAKTPEQAKTSEPTDVAAKKGPLAKIGQIKKPEEKKSEEPAKPATPATDPSQGEEKPFMKLLRGAKDELDKIKPEYEGLKKENELTKAELQKLKAMGLNEKEREEYRLYREMNAVEAEKRSEKYQREVMGPIKHHINKIESVAKNAKLDASQTAALLEAVDEPDDFQRERKIRALVKGTGAEGDLEPEEYQALARIAITNAEKLNEELYPEQDKRLAQAEERQRQAHVNAGKQNEELRTKAEQEYRKEHDEMHRILTIDHFGPLLDDADIAVEGTTLSDALKNVEMPKTASDHAFNILAGASVPFLVNDANRWRTKYHELEAATRLRNGAAPKPGDGKTKPTYGKPKQLDANEVFKSIPSMGTGQMNGWSG